MNDDRPRCPLCEAPFDRAAAFEGVDRLHGTAGRFEVCCCSGCGAGRTFPEATRSDLTGFYPSRYGPYDDGLGSVARVVSRAVRWAQGRRLLTRPPLRVLAEMPLGRVVDVGCGRGDLAVTLIRRGWQVTGIEPSGTACAAARGRGVDARQGTLAEVELEDASYDAVIFQHSLEHTTEPREDLTRAIRALRQGGVVLVTVPNFGCWQRRRFRDRWYHLDLPRHRTHFTPQSLEAALHRAGAHLEELTTSSSSVGLPATLQYAIAGRCLFPDGLPLRIATGLCLLVHPIARALDRGLGGGDQLHAVARRLR